MMEVVPFQKEPSFWVWGLRAYTVLMVLEIKKKTKKQTISDLITLMHLESL